MTDKKEEAPPQETPKGEKKLQKESDQSVWADITEGKFKTAEELAKSYKELEKKLGDNSEEVRQAREQMTALQPVIEVIRDDPELFKQLDSKLREKFSPTEVKKDDAKGTDEKSGIRDVASDLILARFEERHGIDKMSKEEKGVLRQQIGDAIFSLTGTSLNGVDLRRLDTTLENAYIIAEHKSKSAVSDSETEDRASFSGVPAKAGKEETVLTPDEASVADKLGLSREQYLSGKKGRQS